MKLAESLVVKSSLGTRIAHTLDKWNNRTNRYTVTDNDTWFKTREVGLKLKIFN